MGKRVKAGDVLEVGAGARLLYLQYLGKHTEYGDAVTVCPVEHVSRPSDYGNLFASGYVIFYPARAAVARGLALIVGTVAADGVPKMLRRPGARMGTTVKAWVVEDGTGEEVKQQLSAEELRLPIAVIWNHELLLQRVHEGWRPEREGT